LGRLEGCTRDRVRDVLCGSRRSYRNSIKMQPGFHRTGLVRVFKDVDLACGASIGLTP
jgi:hypothetical protein